MPKRKPLDPNNPEDKAKIDSSNVEILDFTLVKNPKGTLGELCYLVKCKDCGKEWYKPKHTFGEQRCMCSKTINGYKFREGYKNITSRYFITLKHNGLSRGLEFSISRQDLWDLWVKQGGKCALSGIGLTFQKSHKQVKYMTASVDRIDSSKGYTKDNIQWVLKQINMMKFVYSNSEFIQMCRMIVSYQDSKKIV